MHKLRKIFMSFQDNKNNSDGKQVHKDESQSHISNFGGGNLIESNPFTSNDPLNLFSCDEKIPSEIKPEKTRAQSNNDTLGGRTLRNNKS